MAERTTRQRLAAGDDALELRREVEARFTPEQRVDGYLAAYERLLDSKVERLSVSHQTTAPATVAAAAAS